MLLIASLSSAVAVGAQSVPASPGEVVPGGFGSWAELLAVQARLDVAADQVVALGGEGFAGTVTAAENRELRVYWKGVLPPDTADLVTRLRGEVPVSVLPAPYSGRELSAEAARLIGLAGVTSVAREHDGSGLVVATREEAAWSALSSAVPLRRTTSTPVPASRGADTPPYWGGARWSSPTGQCSTGFAVRVGGASRMLSAGHCANNGERARSGGGLDMGEVSGKDEGHDRLLIHADSAGRVYDGGVGTGEFSKAVGGARANHVGDWLCTSGAFSGVRCGSRVTAVGLSVRIQRPDGTEYVISPVAAAEQVDRLGAVGNGDSGGPVFDLSGPDPDHPIAKGTLSAIDLSAEALCQGVPAGEGRRCAWRFFHIDVVDSLTAYNATIATG
ncbi:S1 family peptidase [Saccharothrix obliqua]|uniref:S1 family peptidase n=1 Tax=Saccharothrix obliqua TaxID=2861747 RepID=UPI001C5FCCA2|nr:S1 family peptidase [Saccharothrix obliqua]MBW4718275.1 S1 family peptidase [Saccharothrix obliqua]